jgi:hypothetical protein
MDEKWNEIWKDQQEFNRELRDEASNFTELTKCRLTGDLALHLMDEVHELLRHVKWRKYRKNNGPLNPRMIQEELIDIFKMWMCLAQVWEPDMDSFIPIYWEKSAVVRRRHAEEFLRNSQHPSAVIDLDNVLANFDAGFDEWLNLNGIRPVGSGTGRDRWELWNRHKHAFRKTGGFRLCPLMPGAREFVNWCHDMRWNVVFLTSRSIDEYPSILTDTVWWMREHDLIADFVWWGRDKAAKLEQEDVLSHVQLAVDDNEHFVKQYVEAGVKEVVWLRPGEEDVRHPSGYWQVPSLHVLMKEYANAIQ